MKVDKKFLRTWWINFLSFFAILSMVLLGFGIIVGLMFGIIVAIEAIGPAIGIPIMVLLMIVAVSFAATLDGVNV